MKRKTEPPNHLNPDEMMRKTSIDLVRISIKAFMNMCGVDRETAERWIARAVMIVLAESRD